MTPQKRLCNFAGRLMRRRWIRFGLIGGLATISYFLLGLLFVNLMRLPLLAGNALAYVVSFFISYAGQSLWTFRAKGSHAAMLPKFALAQAIGLAINSCIVAFLNKLGLDYELCMAVAITAVPVFVYLICKYWVFRVRDEERV